MPFPSYAFLLAFLPVALAGYFLCGPLRGRASFWLGLASLSFALQAGPFSPLSLAVVAGCAYLAGQTIAAAPHGSPAARGSLILGLAVLAAVGETLRLAVPVLDWAGSPGSGGEAWRIGGPGVPWALSFVLLGQAAYLLDLYRGGPASPGFASHALWTGFFPKLPAGPSLSRAEWDAQRARPGALRFQPENAASGLGLFACGLAKKTVLADNLSLLVRHLFDDLARQGAPGPFFAWAGALAFAFQIYFELSGYADMALGAARMFNIALPPAFDAPYRSRDVSAFWSRWYRPLWKFAGDLAAVFPGKPAIPLALLALGAWHALPGRAWPFLAWGAWSALCLAVHRSRNRPSPPPWAAGGLTFLAVLLGWVLFRSATLTEAGTVLAALAGAGPHGSPLRQLAPLFQGPDAKEYALAFAALASSPFLALHGPSSEARFGPGWRPTLAGAVATACLLLLSILCLPSAREFLYARF